MFVRTNSHDICTEGDERLVFRLLTAELQNAGASDPNDSSVVGTIKVVDNILGSTRARQIHYSTLQCCGIRLDVGSYYVPFIEEDGTEFFAHSGNVVEIGEMYYRGIPERGGILAVLSGKKGLEDVFSEY